MPDKISELVDSVINTFQQMLKADMMPEEKLTLLSSACLNELFHEMVAKKGLGALTDDSEQYAEHRRNLLFSAIDWLLSFDEVPDREFEKYCYLGEIVSAASENRDAWLVFKKLYVQFLIEQKRIDEAVLKLEELSELLPGDKEIQDMAKKYKGQQSSHGGQNSSVGKKTPGFKTGCDIEFYALIDRLKTDSINQLLSNAATCANKWVEEDHEYYGLLLKWYRSWYRVGLFGQDEGFVNYFGGMYQYLKQNTGKLVLLYEQLEDYRSKLTLKTILQHWMTFHPDLRATGKESQFAHYFDLDIMQCDENEVFVDCGCYNGDTVKDFIHAYGSQYKSIYSYELTPSMYEIAKANLKDVRRLHLRNAGVSDKNGQFPFWAAAEGTSQAGNRLNPNGSSMAKVVKIDDDIKEDITFIKMDIEGAELDALHGAEQQIRRNKPKLAISLYHKLSDLIEIPKLVKSYVPEYKFYLRHNLGDGFPFPSEYVLLAKI